MTTKTKRILSCLLTTTLLGSACELEPIADDSPPLEPMSEQENAIFGVLNFDGCTLTQEQELTRAVRVGRWVVQTPEFEDCMRGNWGHTYRPCFDEDDMQTTQSGIDAARSANATEIDCEDLDPGTLGSAGVEAWDYEDEEEINIDTGLIDGAAMTPIALGSLASVAKTIWHEIMHQHGYRHGNSTAATAAQRQIENRDWCGQGGTWIWNVNSMPYHLGACVEQVANDIADRRIDAAGYTGNGRNFRIVLLEAALGAGGVAGSSAIDTAILAMAWQRKLRVEHSQQCLDIPNASGADGAAVNQFTCHGNANQRWITLPMPQLPTLNGQLQTLIMNVNSGKCLDRPNGAVANHTLLQQFTCHGGSAQRFIQRPTANGPQWEAVGTNGAPSGQCLDVPSFSTTAGTRLQMSQCKSAPHDLRNQIIKLVF